MLDALHVGAGAMTGFSRALGNISDNVANLNTPGFKRTQLSFSTLLQDQDQAANGQQPAGVRVADPQSLFSQGEIRPTGNELDAAINGNGFFVLMRDDRLWYSRDGQFRFDADGYLTAQASGARVAVLQDGRLQPLDIRPLSQRGATPTSRISLKGNLSSGDADAQHGIRDIPVISANGSEQRIQVSFSRDPAGDPATWLVSVTDPTGQNLGAGTLQFAGDGSPAAGHESLRITLSNGQPLLLSFGSAGSFSGLTHFSAGGESTAALEQADGRSPGVLTATRFNPDGALQLAYSNGEVTQAGRLALASFGFSPQLEAAGENLYRTSGPGPVLGRPGEPGFGLVEGASIESANVDLTRQFADLIVTQRAYQASSQIMSAVNEMLQQTLDMKGRR